MMVRSLLVIAALWPAAAFAADLALPPQRKPAPANVNVFAPPDATCVEWTDGCRICRKQTTGDPACSNVGMACTPQAPRCTGR